MLSLQKQENRGIVAEDADALRGGTFLKLNKALPALVLAVCLTVSGVLALWLQSQAQAPEAPAENYSLIITEICTKNESVLADNTGKFRDYIELYNASAEPVDLTGFRLTDGQARSAPLEGPVLQSGQYWVLFLGDAVTGFGLGAGGGDTVQLLDRTGAVVVQTRTASLQPDQVMLWQEGEYALSYEASPGFSNDAAGLAAFRTGRKTDTLTVAVSEILVANCSTLPDGSGLFSDLLELCNTGSQPVSLAGWYLSDDPANRLRFRLPEVTLAAGECLVVLCDGSEEADDAYIHANFRLSALEQVCLTAPNGDYVTVQAVHQGDDISLALTEDGYAPRFPSPGWPNTAEGVLEFLATRLDPDGPLVISEVLLSAAGVPCQGKMQDAVELMNISNSSVSTSGWYLSDSSDPYAFPLPQQTLAPGETMVLLCTPNTTGFALSEGESLRLTAPDHRYSLLSCTVSEGRSLSLTDAATLSYGFEAVTLGYPNEARNAEAYLQQQLGDGLRISEVMSANASYLPGAYGTTSDWLELYNASKEPVQLSRYAISNNSGNLNKFPLPDKTLAPGEYCVLLLANDTVNLPRGYSILPFTLSSQGEPLYLSREGEVEDYVAVPALTRDVSYGRTDSACFLELAQPTPGKSNSGAAQKSAQPTAATAQGSYDGVEYLDVVLEAPGTIYYTTDATAPGRYSTRYTGPIRIKKTTVIRAVCIESGKSASAPLDLTYLINENDGVSAVSIITEPGNLFNETYGIYTLGKNVKGEYPYYDANYFQNWEYPATVTLMETDGTCGFSQPCGIKTFGGYSRAYPKKSLACLFRSRYGADCLEYPLFGEGSLDTYEALVLRACGQDVYHARIRDEIITSVAGDFTSLAVQDYRPVVVYLNGTYFGIHFIREKLNENYVAGHYNVAAETATVVEGEGELNAGYQSLLRYATSHDLSQKAHYDEMCSRMNMENYMEYIFSQIWIANMDNNNVKYFTADGIPWTWILFDTDLSMHNTSYDSVWFNLNPAGTGGGYVSTDLINALLKNKQFREDFLRTGARLVNEVWTEENLLPRIDALAQLIRADMEKDCARWGTNYQTWEREVEILKDFVKNRTPYVVDDIQNYFGLTDSQMADYGY